MMLSHKGRECGFRASLVSETLGCETHDRRDYGHTRWLRLTHDRVASQTRGRRAGVSLGIWICYAFYPNIVLTVIFTKCNAKERIDPPFEVLLE